MESLEALREMVTSTLKYDDNLINKISNLSNIVLKDLERLKQLEEEKMELLLAHSKVLKNSSETNKYVLDIIKENEKLKQAIDILKTNYFRVEKNANTDYGYIAFIEAELTKEQYELLKEVLGNENSNL